MPWYFKLTDVIKESSGELAMPTKSNPVIFIHGERMATLD